MISSQNTVLIFIFSLFCLNFGIGFLQTISSLSFSLLLSRFFSLMHTFSRIFLLSLVTLLHLQYSTRIPYTFKIKQIKKNTRKRENKSISVNNFLRWKRITVHLQRKELHVFHWRYIDIIFECAFSTRLVFPSSQILLFYFFSSSSFFFQDSRNCYIIDVTSTWLENMLVSEEKK